MSPTECTVKGTLNPDGTLELNEKPNLSPGRVTVVLRQESQLATTLQQGWWQAMQDARKNMEEAGCHFLNEKAMHAHLEWLREEDRVDELLREANAQRQKSEQP